jgi:glycosyltransferase involved in cell wall biosynthesis
MVMKRRVTFVLPGDNWSGGVRVTVIMGNLLLTRGYQVRIAARDHRMFSVDGAKARLARLGRRVGVPRDTGWLQKFSGKIERYVDLNDLAFEPGEVVIAVGTYMVQEVRSLRKDVIRVRYNHGFPAQMTDEYRTAWSVPMRTITVSNTLVHRLEELSGQKVLAVVPNGIDTTEYFPVPAVPRDSIGTIYSSHPNKAPHDILRLLNTIGVEFPSVARLVFSAEPRPAGLSPCHYERFPSVERAREIYSRSVVWLLASYTEGLPAPVLEAMACGAVVISSDNDGSLEVVKDGVNGLIVPKGNIDAFIDRIRTVFSDDALRRRLVQGGLETVQTLTWATAADRMDDFLQRCTSELSITQTVGM